MGTAVMKILKIDADGVITLLNKAFADDLAAYCPYRIGAKVSKDQ